jgi:hypothetical protein
MANGSPERWYFPRWMLKTPPAPLAPTEEEKAAFEKYAKEHAEAKKKEFLSECRRAAVYLNVIPLYGQAAYAAAVAACEIQAASGNFDVDRSIFGPINQWENQRIKEETDRGAPVAPPFCIIDCTPAKKEKYESDFKRYQVNYARWKYDDMRRGLPPITREQWQKFTDAEKKMRAEAVGRYAAQVQAIERPGWLKTVVRAEAQEMVDQLKTFTTPTLVQRLGALGAYEYVALGLAAALAAAAAVFATRVPPRRTR